MKISLKNWRIWIAEGYVIIALVVTAVMAVATAIYLQHELRDSDRDREVAGYRETARQLRDGEIDSERRKAAGDLLVAAGRLGRGSWGFEYAKQGRVLVWYREPRQDSVKLAYVDKAFVNHWCGSFTSFMGAALLTVLLLALLSVRHFVGFLKERDDFLHATVHDLRTPIATLQLQARRASPSLQQTAARLGKLVGNLSEFLKLGGKRPAPKRENVELVGLFREAYEYFREGYEDVESKVEFQGADRLTAVADSDLVLQIFWNLLGNDLKYAAAEGPVAATFAIEKGRAIVRVADVGPGMSRSAMRKCFNRYYRATTIEQSGKGGFGIGLCNALEFARAMRGTLTVSANRPHGCVFTLSLPVVP